MIDSKVGELRQVDALEGRVLAHDGELRAWRREIVEADQEHLHALVRAQHHYPFELCAWLYDAKPQPQSLSQWSWPEDEQGAHQRQRETERVLVL